MFIDINDRRLDFDYKKYQFYFFVKRIYIFVFLYGINIGLINTF